MNSEYSICICGGGALGHVMASVLSANGCRVNILTRRPLIWSKTIEAKDLLGKRIKGVLRTISDKPEEVIPQSDIVLLCLPGNLIDPEIKKIKNYLKQDAIVGSIVGSTGFFITAISNLGKDFGLFAFQRVPYIARVEKYGYSANLLGYKKHLNMFFRNVKDSERYLSFFSTILSTPITLLESIWEVTLTNSNPLLHTTRLYRMFNDWKEDKVFNRVPLFYEEWDNETSDLLIKCDNEFQTLLSHLSVDQSKIPSLLKYYESNNKEELTQKIISITAFKGIKAPMKQVHNGYIPDFENRYYTEDFLYGLLLIKLLAQQLLVHTPNIDKVLNWGQSVLKKNLIANNVVIMSKDTAEISCLNVEVIKGLLKED